LKPLPCHSKVHYSQQQPARCKSIENDRRCLVHQHQQNMSAIFNFSSLVTALLLSICTTTYLRELRPTIFDGSVIDAAGTASAQVGLFESSGPFGTRNRLGRLLTFDAPF
jgi:hypothetical protein